MWFCEMRQMPRLRDCASELAAGVLRWFGGLLDSREGRPRPRLIPRESWTAFLRPTGAAISPADGDADGIDRDRFRAAVGKTASEAGYLWYFRFDGDVDGRDNGEFNRRFGLF